MLDYTTAGICFVQAFVLAIFVVALGVLARAELVVLVPYPLGFKTFTHSYYCCVL